LTTNRVLKVRGLKGNIKCQLIGFEMLQVLTRQVLEAMVKGIARPAQDLELRDSSASKYLVVIFAAPSH
jgi:hypothetical protein